MTVQEAILAFRRENPVLMEELSGADTLEDARERVLSHIIRYETITLSEVEVRHPMDRAVARRCLHALKNIFSRRSESLSGFCALEAVWKMATGKKTGVEVAFVEEMRHLFRGMRGATGMYGMTPAGEASVSGGRMAARLRSVALDGIAETAHRGMERFASGMDPEVIRMRQENRNRIITELGASREQWDDWRWQCRNVIRDADMAMRLIHLTREEEEGIRQMTQLGLPFGITPYYASLMDPDTGRERDHAVRAQVIPPLSYTRIMGEQRNQPLDLDFMGESDTSPQDLITRRYPMITIFKPYNTCAQICVYCQRNWEIGNVLERGARAPEEQLETAIRWHQEHPEVTEVLVTGGDPAILGDRMTGSILKRLSGIPHIRRIRIGTRTPVVLPMRITEAYADLLAGFREPGYREICLMTHFEHPYEVTPEALEAVERVRCRGIPVYNQGVFTPENARRFEMAALRRSLRSIGVDPYYTFNTKGKEETRAYRVPIARLLQEQAEEARLTPGLDRTDEAVFNIPRLGKNYLRAGQNHEVIMILPDGKRVYEFYPWDMSLEDVSPYMHTDPEILGFLQEMEARGENPGDYESIWYYL